MNTISKCLFGGALLGAGLSSPAIGGDVVWGAGSSFAYAPLYLQSTFVSGDWSLSSTYEDGSYASSIGTNLGLSIIAFGANSILGSASAYRDFTVSHDMLISFEWDLNASGNAVTITDSAGIVFNENVSLSSVPLELSFMAGETYHISGRVASIFGQSRSFTMTGGSDINVVPLPPAAFGGLAMLAGLGAYRRIRR